MSIAATPCGHPPEVSPRFAFAVRVLRIRRDRGCLDELWSTCRHTWSAQTFLATIERVTHDSAVLCIHCSAALWTEDAHQTADGDDVCDACCDDLYSTCYHCEQLHRHVDWVNDEPVCSSCLDRYYEWCESCGTHVDEGHVHDCCCEAPHLRFTFPANGDGSIANDSRLTVTLPAGVIDDRGLTALVELLHGVTGSYHSARCVYDLDHQWVTREGNFTRRLSRLLFKVHGIKLPAGVLSEVGNVARMHSSETSAWHIEFTRDLNHDAAAFYHAESCWWTDHADSRCALKACGGLGLRSYVAHGRAADSPNGRAWILPLDGTLRPTHATRSHAYVVFNEYGALEGYVAARLVAHLTSKTYRKIRFVADPMYVNGDSGLLIAEQTVCDATEEISLNLPIHVRGIAA